MDSSTFKCTAKGGKDISQRECWGICGNYQKHVDNCSKCACPWRVCPMCVLRGLVGERKDKAFVVDADKGLCQEHLINIDFGKKAEEGKGEESMAEKKSGEKKTKRRYTRRTVDTGSGGHSEVVTHHSMIITDPVGIVISGNGGGISITSAASMRTA